MGRGKRKKKKMKEKEGSANKRVKTKQVKNYIELTLNKGCGKALRFLPQNPHEPPYNKQFDKPTQAEIFRPRRKWD